MELEREGKRTYRCAVVSDEDFSFDALGDDAAGEEDVVEGEGGCPGTRDCWIYV